MRKVTRMDSDIDKLIDKPFDPSGIDFSIIIDRTSFKLALQDRECRKLLVCILMCAKSACFTDLMPRDKGNVVKLLKKNVAFKPVVAAVGIGEGDINMLQLADVGIGIYSNEDSFAMNYSDVNIQSFNQLESLLLLHGHYNYTRLSKVILLFLYKNCFLTIFVFAFTFLCNFSGTSIFNSSLLIGYNIFFTTLPILVIGVYDQDVPSDKMLTDSQIYTSGINNTMFNTKSLLKYMLISVVQGVILILLNYLCYPVIINPDGNEMDFILLGTVTYIILIVAVLIQIYIEANSYSIIFFVSMLLSIICLIIFVTIESTTFFPDSSLYGVGTSISKSGVLIISMFFSSLAVVIPVYFFYSFFEVFSPKILEKIKSNQLLLNYEVKKLESFSKNLGKIYKNSSIWKNKLEDQKFAKNPLTLQFKTPHIEKKYADGFIVENLFFFKSTIGFL